MPSRSIAPTTPKKFTITSGEARIFRDLLLLRREWIHRQIETIHLLSDGDTRRKVSVDLDVQDMRISGIHVLPISVLKKSVLKSFDVKSASNSTLSVLTSEQTNQVEMEILRTGLQPRYRRNADEMLRDIVSFEPTYEDESFDFNSPNHPAYMPLFDYYHQLDKTNVTLAMEMINLAALFVKGFLLVVQIPEMSKIGTRTVLKYSYEEPLDLELNILLRPKKVAVYLLTDWSKSYHLEVRTPQPIAIRKLSLHRIGEDGKSTTAIAKRQAFDVTGRQIAHVTISGVKPDDRYVAFIYLRADTRGLPRAASLATFLTYIGSVLLFTSLIPHLFDRTPSYDAFESGGVGIATTILILAPSLLFAFLAKRSNHHIEARILAAPRFALLLSALLMFGEGFANAHPLSDTVWHFPLPKWLPFLSGTLLGIYWLWYVFATNSGHKNLKWIRAYWKKAVNLLGIVFLMS